LKLLAYVGSGSLYRRSHDHWFICIDILFLCAIM
jgi:hypothetical protein